MISIALSIWLKELFAWIEKRNIVRSLGTVGYLKQETNIFFCSNSCFIFKAISLWLIMMLLIGDKSFEANNKSLSLHSLLKYIILFLSFSLWLLASIRLSNCVILASSINGGELLYIHSFWQMGINNLLSLELYIL